MIALFTLPFLAIGAWLLKRGRWPARIGSTPHCPHCDYILTGIEAERCPECGRAIWAGNFVLGERGRKPGKAIAGLLLILIGILFLTLDFAGGLRHVDWYHYRPTAWVLKDLDAKSPPAQTKAWYELHRRSTDGSLSAAQQDAMVERALREQETGNGAGGYRVAMVDFLFQRYRDGKLSDAQTARFFDNGMKLKLDVRPLVGAPDRVPFSVFAIGRGPTMGMPMWGLWVQTNDLGMWIDGKKIDTPKTSYGGGACGGWGCSRTLDPQSPGKHRLRIDLEVGAGIGPVASLEGPLSHVRTVQLTGDFQVTPEEPPLKWLTSPNAAVIQRCISASDFAVNTGPYQQPLTGTINVMNPPVDLAFDVFARANGKEYPLGGVSFHAGGGSWGVATPTPPPGDFRTIDIILRSSEAVARGTIEITQIWRGEIVLSNVPVRRPPTSRPATLTSN